MVPLIGCVAARAGIIVRIKRIVSFRVLAILIWPFVPGDHHHEEQRNEPDAGDRDSQPPTSVALIV